MKITVYCGSKLGKGEKYKECAQNIGKWIADQGHSLVYGGGKVGLMGAVADSVLENKGEVIGIIPTFLMKEEVTHRYIHKLTVVETMSERKYRMIQEGQAFIALPGGLGTLEELSEVISWARIGQNNKPCIIYNEGGYYNSLNKLFDTMTQEGFLDQEDREKIFFAESIEEIEEYINEFQPPIVHI